MARHKIIVSVVDGKVKYVEAIPSGIEIVIRHYDTEGVDEQNLILDEIGEEFWEATWLPKE